MAPSAEPPVDLLYLIRHLVPIANRTASAAHQLGPQPGLADQALELSGEGQDVAGREQQPSLSVPRQLAIDREIGGNGNGARPERCANERRRGPWTSGRHAYHVGCGDQLIGLCLARAEDAYAVPKAAGDPDVALVRQPHHGLPRDIGRQTAERPQEKPQRATLLVKAEGDAHRALALHRPGAQPFRPVRLEAGIGSRRNELIRTRKEALHESRGRIAAYRPRVQAPEEDLDQRPRHLRRENSLGWLVEAPDVQRSRVAKGDRRGAGRERVVDVDHVQLDAAKQRLERTSEVDRDRCGARARSAWHGKARSHRQHRGARVTEGPRTLPGAVEQRCRALASGLDGPARLADLGARARRSRDHYPVPPFLELSGDSLDELVHLVRDSP